MLRASEMIKNSFELHIDVNIESLFSPMVNFMIKIAKDVYAKIEVGKTICARDF